MIEFIEIIFTAGFWAATIRIACPLILATIGEVLCERAGVLNLGIEGIMSIGAMVGWMTVFLGADLYTGILAALIIGGLFGLLHAIFYCLFGCFPACYRDWNNDVGILTRIFLLQAHFACVYHTPKNQTIPTH